MKVTDFLSGDLKRAINEKKCVYACMDKVEEHLHHGDFTRARDAAFNMMRSIDALEKMNMEKRSQDKLNELAFIATQNKVPVQLLVPQVQKKG